MLSEEDKDIIKDIGEILLKRFEIVSGVVSVCITITPECGEFVFGAYPKIQSVGSYESAFGVYQYATLSEALKNLKRSVTVKPIE